MPKTYVQYVEGYYNNYAKRDNLIANMPAMKKNRGYDSVALCNLYNDYYEPTNFVNYFEPLYKAASANGIQILMNVVTYLSPAWGQAVYGPNVNQYFPLFYGHERTWDSWLNIMQKIATARKKYGENLVSKYVYMDFEEMAWASQNLDAMSEQQVMRIATQMQRFCERAGDLGLIPVAYSIDGRPANTGTPNFTQTSQTLVSALTDSNIMFGDTTQYPSPHGSRPEWCIPFSETLKLYPDEAQSKLFVMSIENYNAPYGWTFDDWDKFVATNLQANPSHWFALFGAVVPT